MRLEDLGSSNGTYHNGVRVEKEALLQPGDSIQIGPVVFVLQVDGVPADEDLNPIIADAAVGAAGEAVDDATQVTQQYGYADDAVQPAETVGTIDTLDTISVLPDDMGHGEAEPSQSDAARHSGHDDLEALDLDDENGLSGGEHLNLLDLDAPPEGEGQLHIDDLDQADSNPSRQRPQ
jgi:pSer/pThr/pTyr-binding forkhead associated (FHA) protein